MKFQIYRGHGTQPWRWRLLAKNSKIIADSGEGYKTRRGCKLAVNRVIDRILIACARNGHMEIEVLGARV
jgi:uncharacterized protein YegP (UPF0339 family)